MAKLQEQTFLIKGPNRKMARAQAERTCMNAAPGTRSLQQILHKRGIAYACRASDVCWEVPNSDPVKSSERLCCIGGVERRAGRSNLVGAEKGRPPRQPWSPWLVIGRCVETYRWWFRLFVHEAGTIGIGEELTWVENQNQKLACSATLALRDIGEIHQT